MLLDFGLVKKFQRQASLGTQVFGRAKTFGRPGYAPIEQYQQQSATDPRSDVFSLAATLYFMLTGEEPTPAPDRIYHDDMIPPHFKNSAISPDISKAVMWGLHIEASLRPATVRIFLDALELVLRRKQEEKKQRLSRLAASKIKLAPAASPSVSPAGIRNDAIKKVANHYMKLLNRNPHKRPFFAKLRDQHVRQMGEQVDYWMSRGLTLVEASQKWAESACEAGNREEQL